MLVKVQGQVEGLDCPLLWGTKVTIETSAQVGPVRSPDHYVYSSGSEP